MNIKNLIEESLYYRMILCAKGWSQPSYNIDSFLHC